MLFGRSNTSACSCRSAILRNASATSSYFKAFYAEQLRAQAYATGDVASQLTQRPSADIAKESLDENYCQMMSFVANL